MRDWREELSPHAREVLASAAEDHCGDAAFARMAERLDGALLAELGLGDSEPLSDGLEQSNGMPEAKTLTSWQILVGGGLFMAVYGAAVFGAAHWLTPASQPLSKETPARVEMPEIPIAEPRQRDRAEGPPVEGVSEGVPAERPDAMRPNGSMTTRIQGGREQNARAARAIRANEQDQSSPPEDEEAFAAELRLLSQIRRTHRQQPDLALRLVDRHRRDFPDSPFADEREYYGVLAVSYGIGGRAAERALDTYERAYPNSPYRQRLRTLLRERSDSLP